MSRKDETDSYSSNDYLRWQFPGRGDYSARAGIDKGTFRESLKFYKVRQNILKEGWMIQKNVVSSGIIQLKKANQETKSVRKRKYILIFFFKVAKKEIVLVCFLAFAKENTFASIRTRRHYQNDQLVRPQFLPE